MKDPAFLFYTKDFQAGTQHMTCEEVGAYLRLLLFQHQHGSIPNETERLMRITGIFSTGKFNEIWKSVNEKFNETDNKLLNERLSKEVTLRSVAKPHKIIQTTLAGLISSNKDLTKNQKLSIRSAFKTDDFIHLELKEISPAIRDWFYNFVNGLVNNKANGNGNGNEDVIAIEKGKEGTGEKPTLILPYTSPFFAEQWQVWKNYRAKEHKQRYLSTESEQAALAELNTLATGNETTAIAILHQSMGKGWKGLFELKQDSNATGSVFRGKAKVRYSDDFKRKIAERLRSG